MIAHLSRIRTVPKPRLRVVLMMAPRPFNRVCLCGKAFLTWEESKAQCSSACQRKVMPEVKP